MTINYNISTLFNRKPQQWGLRGDPYLWDEMKVYFKNIDPPKTEEEFHILIEHAFEKLTGCSLFHTESIFVPRYDKGGMSSGHVSSEFWIDKGIPLLLKRFRDFNE